MQKGEAIQRTAFLSLNPRRGEITRGWLQVLVKTHEHTLSRCSEWSPRGRRDGECGPDKCPSANGSEWSPGDSGAPSLLGCFQHPRRGCRRHHPGVLFRNRCDATRIEGTKRPDDNYARRPCSMYRVRGSLRSSSTTRWRRFDGRRVIAHPCIEGKSRAFHVELPPR